MVETVVAAPQTTTNHTSRMVLELIHYSKYAILREVVESEFADDVPED